MNQLDGSKFCHKICHIFGKKVVKECKRYITLHNFQPLVANAYKKIFDFCEKNVKIDRLWLIYEFCKTKTHEICKAKCYTHAIEECNRFVEDKMLDNDMALLKSYDANKSASETTYFTIVIKRKVIDFCKHSKIYSQIAQTFDVDRIVDEVLSIDKQVIKEDLIEQLTTLMQQLRSSGKLSRNEKMVIKLMLENYEYSEMATLLGVETKELYRIKDRALKKIAKAWKGER